MIKLFTKPEPQPQLFAIGAIREPEKALTKPKPIALTSDKIDPAFLAAVRNQSSLASDYRRAATTLLAQIQPNPASQTNSLGQTRQIFVTSPRAGEGKTSTAFNLAWTLAESGKTVLLVELNFMHPRLRDALGDLRPRFGLEGALRGAAEPQDAVLSFESNPRLFLAPIRNITPADRLASVLEHLNDFLRWGARQYDLLVMDCPSVLSEDWSAWFHDFVGPALLVVRHGTTPQFEVQKAIHLLGANLKCALLNRVPQASGSSVSSEASTGSLREMPSKRQTVALGEAEKENGTEASVAARYTN
jgi:Mrp family chromosome partitioning ATPase